MERDSFIFYRSFYEAIKCMPPEIQTEIYPAVIEYALYGTLPDNLSEIAKGMFLLIKPNIDVNTARYKNGSKGGRRRVRAEKKTDTSKENEETYSETFENEVSRMKSDDEWLRENVCKKYSISKDEAVSRLDTFLLHCNNERSEKPHEDYDDARQHFCFWMCKAYPQENAAKITGKKTQSTKNKPVTDPLARAKAEAAKEKERREREAEFERRRKNAGSPDDFIRSKGYDPAFVTVAQVMNPEWCKANPPQSPP